MRLRRKRTVQTVYGKALRAPRVTYAAVGLMALYVGAPIIGLGLALDLAVWAGARAMFGVCLGLWCWVG